MTIKDPKSWAALAVTALVSIFAGGYGVPRIAPELFTPEISRAAPLLDYRLTILENSLVGISRDISSLRDAIGKLPPERLIDRVSNLETKVEVLINQMNLMRK